jgi:carboxylesterase family protein
MAPLCYESINDRYARIYTVFIPKRLLFIFADFSYQVCTGSSFSKMKFSSLFAGLSISFSSCLANPVQNIPSAEGLIDLGYAKHVPTYVNTTASGRRIAIYKNIRFGLPTNGTRRFRKPDTSLPKTEGVQDGKVPWGTTDCIASAPGVVPFPGINGTSWGHEDCLFLDVYVPEDIKPSHSVPVLHWIFGSAYVLGSKDILFSPIGLFDNNSTDKDFILVANNYR